MEIAKQIANVSLRIESGTKVYLKYKSGDSITLIKLIIEEISAKGEIVFPIKYDKELEDFLMSTYTSSSIDAVIQKSCLDNSFFDVFISLGSNDDYVKTSKSNLHVLDELKIMKMSLETITDGKKWLLLNYPSIVDSNNLIVNKTFDKCTITPNIFVDNYKVDTNICTNITNDENKLLNTFYKKIE